ncbi:MAG: hypothetical protein ABI068_00315 [Ktedonobacterales bacterium]
MGLLLAIMLFNELPTSALTAASAECRRVLRADRQLLTAVPHPAFVQALAKKGVLTNFGRGLFALPGADRLKLPVSRRPVQAYISLLTGAEFSVMLEDGYADEKTLHEKSGLSVACNISLALSCDCRADRAPSPSPVGRGATEKIAE